MDYYIAIDVSKEVLSVFDGERELTFENERDMKALGAYLREKFNGYRNVVIIFESTGAYSNYLKEFCANNKIRACIINPKRSSNFSKVIGNRSKTDKIDARTLYAFRNLIESGDIEVPVVDEGVEVLSAYLSSYEFIIKMRVSISNHIEALEHNSKAPRGLLSVLRRELERAEKLERGILDKASEYIEGDDELREGYHNLLTIPGIGKVGAVVLLYLFRKYGDTNRCEITALVGLDPTRKESGSSICGRRKISKNGNGMVRKVLYLPTLNAIVHNMVIRRFYERLLENHKPKKLAVIAAMRKLLLIAHVVYKNKVRFSIA